MHLDALFMFFCVYMSKINSLFKKENAAFWIMEIPKKGSLHRKTYCIRIFFFFLLWRFPKGVHLLLLFIENLCLSQCWFVEQIPFFCFFFFLFLSPRFCHLSLYFLLSKPPVFEKCFGPMYLWPGLQATATDNYSYFYPLD